MTLGHIDIACRIQRQVVRLLEEVGAGGFIPVATLTTGSDSHQFIAVLIQLHDHVIGNVGNPDRIVCFEV